MRVVQIHNRYRQQGGEDHVVATEAEALRNEGHEVLQHTVANPQTAVASITTLVQAPWNRSSASSVATVVKRFKPDIIHVHNTWFRLSPAVVSAAHGLAPVTMTVHNYRLLCSNAQLLRNQRPCRLCIDGSLWNGVIHSCYRDPLSSGFAALTIRRGRKQVWRSDVDLFLTLSRFSSQLLGEIGVEEERIMIKDNFVLDPGERSEKAEESRAVLFVGRLTVEKGVEQLLANRRLLTNIGLTLKVIGTGPLAPRVRAELGPNYLGLLDSKEVISEMLGARALIMPSLWYEGQPRTALEAFAAGLPVLGSRHGALGELLGFQPGDWTFDPHGDWSGAVTKLSSNVSIARGSKEARALWRARFDAREGGSQLVKSYQRAIEAHERHL
jgi:glycosyltransferase involved in cell wall biosynthesis